MNVSLLFVYSSNEVSSHVLYCYTLKGKKRKVKKKKKKIKKKKKKDADSRYIFSDRATSRVVFSSA